ncbi:TM2 domain-containing protein almondex [Atta colombica]|uniref:TM2 domain-containing protein almondex n=1 Tax=Atta colombica TaxID=520822 RepID=A0A195BQL4_9HYME|nr:TM2 domain-containing protein almondex [Atta colombica]
MNVVRINSKNVIFLFMALLSTSVQEARMDYGTATSYALKEANVNSTPAYSSKKEEMASLCPSGISCVELSGECLKCNLNYSCKYGVMYETNCSVMEHVDCIVRKTYEERIMCFFQLEIKNFLIFYITNCTVNNDILCLGRRKFMKNLPCNWTVGYRWSTALILSITLGGFGADRFYLGHWQEGIGKLFSFGGLGVWTLIDVILISMRYLGPADGSLYI